MPTIVRFRRDGVPLHIHPVSEGVERWHGPWDRHRDRYAHTREGAEFPTNIEDFSTEQQRTYFRGLHGYRFAREMQEGRTQRVYGGGITPPPVFVEDGIMRVRGGVPTNSTPRERLLAENRRRIEASRAALGIVEVVEYESPVMNPYWSGPVQEPAAPNLEVQETARQILARAGISSEITGGGYALSDRSFGVEIECIGPTNLIGELAHAAGVRLRAEEYNHQNRPHWKIVNDGSLNAGINCPPGFRTMELVSPILRGEDGIRQLRIICGILSATKTIVNKTCGLHVHHDAADLGIASIRRLAHNWANSQLAIDKVVAPSRRGAANPTYCRPLNSDDLQSIDMTSDKNRMGYGSGRYKTLNLCALQKHGTIEIRQHQGTVDFEKIAAWVQFGQKFIDWSAEGNTMPEDSDEIVGVMERINLQDSTRNYFTNRETYFSGERVTTARQGRF